MNQTSFNLGSGGWHHATCPSCGQRFDWMASHQISKVLVCDNETERGVKCKHKMPRSDWEMLRHLERQHATSQ